MARAAANKKSCGGPFHYDHAFITQENHHGDMQRMQAYHPFSNRGSL